MLISFYLEIVLILTQDWCTVCADRIIGSETIHVESHFGPLETVLVSVQDRCTVCAKHNIGSEIVLDASDGTPR
jgi:hypothetical protein